MGMVIVRWKLYCCFTLLSLRKNMSENGLPHEQIPPFFLFGGWMWMGILGKTRDRIRAYTEEDSILGRTACSCGDIL